MNKSKLELFVIDCFLCKEPTEHTYIGDFGLKSSPVHVYQCRKCPCQYQSSKRLKAEGENETKSCNPRRT